MTNGEKMKEIFPQGIISYSGIFIIFDINGYCQQYSPNWWNAEYKEPSYSEKPNKSEIPTGSPTKNDLAVDWDELKRKIFMEVDGGTDDRWLRYVDVCDRISNSIDEFVSRL